MVIVSAQGACHDIIAKSILSSEQQDASGNKLLLDIALWLTHKVKVHIPRYQTFCATGLSPVFHDIINCWNFLETVLPCSCWDYSKGNQFTYRFHI